MSTELVVPGEKPVGLEDYDAASDKQTPRLRIDHDNGVFVDTLSNESLGDELTVIVLGIVKGRVLWDADVKDDAKPMCKSYNFTEGHPDPDTFPFRSVKGVFTRDQIESGETLACSECPLQKWGSHPTRDAPWCTEQHTFALMTPVVNDDEVVGWSPALLTLQRSAIKASRSYMTTFIKQGQPMFTVFTKLTLEQKRQGTVDFAVPKMIRQGGTDKDEWPEFADKYRTLRDFLQMPYTPPTDDADAEAEAETEEPEAKPAKATKKATAPKAAAKDEGATPDQSTGDGDDENLPF